MRDALSALRHLALPLHAAPLLLVGIFAVLLRLAMHAGLLGLPLAAILLSWFFKYAFMLLDHAAQGRPGAPVLTPEAANPVGEMRPVLYAVVCGAFYLLTERLADLFGPGVGVALRVAAMAALPAIVAVHAITGSLFEAMNPRVVFAMVRRLGSTYLLLFAVALACALVGRAVVLDAPGLAVIVKIALLMLLWLGFFALLGGVIHDRRHEVGYEPEQSPERSTQREHRERDRDRDRFVDQLFVEYRTGALKNATQTIRKHIEGSGDPIEEYSWILERVAAWPNPRLGNWLAQELLPRLLAIQRNGEALAIVRQRIAADPGFRPTTSAQLARLAQLAVAGGERPLARALLTDFDRRFPDDPARGSIEQLRRQLER